MKLIQIPFSHNCVKTRLGLARKGLRYEVENIRPVDRASVIRQSGQGLVPVLVDGDRVVPDSTAILLYLEERYPEPALVPKDPARRAECLVLEDWVDRAFMELSRRIAYHAVLETPGRLGSMFFPGSSGFKRRIQERIARRRVAQRFRITDERYPRDVAESKRVAALAIDRLGSSPYLLGSQLTIADLALAAMSAPLAADRSVAADDSVRRLLEWGTPIVREV